MKRNREVVVACGLRGAHPTQRVPDGIIQLNGCQTGSSNSTGARRDGRPSATAPMYQWYAEMKQFHTRCQTAGNQNRSPSSRHCRKPEEVTAFAVSLHLRDLFSVSRSVSAAGVHFSRFVFCPPRSVTQRLSASRSVPSRSALRAPRLCFRVSTLRRRRIGCFLGF